MPDSIEWRDFPNLAGQTSATEWRDFPNLAGQTPATEWRDFPNLAVAVLFRPVYVDMGYLSKRFVTGNGGTTAATTADWGVIQDVRDYTR